MKLLLPQLELDQQKGFAADIDIFKRKDFGERLANLIENADDNPVIALDAGWGEGKSTFIHMWRGYIENERSSKLKAIYFDAFKNDYQKDPFLTLASEIYSLLSDGKAEKKEQFLKKATGAAKSLMRGAIKIGIRATTAGLIDGTAIENVGKDFSSLITDQVDEIISEKLKNVEEDKLALSSFRKYLADMAQELSQGKPIVFIIDELDRCRPDFALELLEQIKHLFSVKGITFLLITNRAQLEESIRCKYGVGVNARNYLHKFVSLWLNLPKGQIHSQDYRDVFIDYALHKMMDENERLPLTETIDLIKEIAQFYDLSLREIERTLTYFAVIHNMTVSKNYNETYQNFIALICFIGANKPSLLTKIHKITYDDFILELGFEKIDNSSQQTLIHYLKSYIKFDLSNEQVRTQMIENKEIYRPSYGRTTSGDLRIIANWLSQIKPGY